MLFSPTSARQVSEEEKRQWINRLAEIYQKQGYKVKGKRYVFPDGTTTTNEVLVKICQVTTLSYATVVKYVFTKFKQTEKARTEEREPRVPASQAIISRIGEDYGKQLVERHREEVKQELLKDKDFIVEVISKAPEIRLKFPIKLRFLKAELQKLSESSKLKKPIIRLFQSRFGAERKRRTEKDCVGTAQAR
jgi:hypothetical protein